MRRQPQVAALIAIPSTKRSTSGGVATGAARSGALAPWVDAVDPVPFQSSPPAIEDRSRDPQLAADRADVAPRLRALDDAQPHSVYALVEGHRWFPWPGVNRTRFMGV
jgi:hypothetical protein